jgi:hypothetical protein
MADAKRSPERATMRHEYDFRRGVRGKYVTRYLEGPNVVVLDPDIAEAFPNAGAVNRALRALLTVVLHGGFDGAAAPSSIFERAAS